MQDMIFTKASTKPKIYNVEWHIFDPFRPQSLVNHVEWTAKMNSRNRSPFQDNWRSNCSIDAKSNMELQIANQGHISGPISLSLNADNITSNYNINLQCKTRKTQQNLWHYRSCNRWHTITITNRRDKMYKIKDMSGAFLAS